MYSKEVVKIFMEEMFGVDVSASKLAEEAVELYLEELDEKIVSPDILTGLPDPVVFLTYSYDEKSEWIIGIALEARN
ncbi:hypothetical protein [Peribacillus sp. TH16]|uniref:hypothetical protein n=1 Tax=Peribacillus sp. TH16 TaxID=2798482 RepID=UPI001F5B036A|nr:hypothetical protein [Peribacillus sp. TH16]